MFENEATNLEDEPVPTDKELLDYLETHPNIELDWDAPDEDGMEHAIYVISGNVNDREWSKIAGGATLREALANAMKAKP